MTSTLQRPTAGELFEMPDDGLRYELVKGGLRRMSPSGSEHGAIAAFVRRERIPESGIPKKFWRGAPDLAVQVLSPGDARREVEERVEDWLEAGARTVWGISPKRRSVAVYRSVTDVTRLAEGDEPDGGEVVAGFRRKVAEIFDEPF